MSDIDYILLMVSWFKQALSSARSWASIANLPPTIAELPLTIANLWEMSLEAPARSLNV